VVTRKPETSAAAVETSRMRRALRQGLTLIEVMVVIAVIGIIGAVGAPALSGILGLQQQAAVKELAQTYAWLIEEASLRNVSFRMSFNLDRGTWKVDVGDAGALIFASPEDAEEHAEMVEDKMRRFTKRQIEEGRADVGEDVAQFQSLEGDEFRSKNTLPEGIRFAFVYTPQYGKYGMEPHDEPPDDTEEDRIAYSHIFPDGTAEHTVIRVVDMEDEDEGYTLQVEPMSGKVLVTEDIIKPSESLSWLPTEGPSLQ
jgi:prepilin-type N-terminal cleavage/methylation domain-containing protein